mmetsp:Transcript_13296/g.35649  ORF Transcript_13296/g.35649 Transcript_13296/m.35649 type:complete len:235 (-) Transcript_13296:67-771(-)
MASFAWRSTSNRAMGISSSMRATYTSINTLSLHPAKMPPLIALEHLMVKAMASSASGWSLMESSLSSRATAAFMDSSPLGTRPQTHVHRPASTSLLGARRPTSTVEVRALTTQTLTARCQKPLRCTWPRGFRMMMFPSPFKTSNEAVIFSLWAPSYRTLAATRTLSKGSRMSSSRPSLLAMASLSMFKAPKSLQLKRPTLASASWISTWSRHRNASRGDKSPVSPPSVAAITRA